MKPVIAIIELGPGLLRMYMKSKYVSTFSKAGATLRWLDASDPQAAARIAAECDGLIVPGGDDVNPKLYGQEISEKCGKINPVRDAIDPVVLKAFLKTGKPVLGICRGEQILNVILGGTLHQDIQGFQKLKHSDFRHRNRGCHAVAIQPGTKLREILGAEEISVNTLHHQAVDAPAPDIAISAISPDGIVEAFELPSHPFCLGVQWHPEFMAARHEHARKLIQAFVSACEAEANR